MSSSNNTKAAAPAATTVGGGSIHVLPQDVVDRIAAGEVVQRPANAVKELLENSLDANSTHIVVHVEKHNGSGKQKKLPCMNLSIHDNGTGMGKADLQMAATRFATSKLTTLADFDSLTSFGFRGEALASISMVSHMTVVSKQPGAKCAYTCAYLDGKPKPGSCKLCARQVGTTVAVKDLFYNVPHRQKSLRPSEEYQRIVSLLQQYAIQVARRGVGLVCQQEQATGKSGNKKKLVDLNTTMLSHVKALDAARRAKQKEEAAAGKAASSNNDNSEHENGEKQNKEKGYQRSYSTEEEQAATRQAITNIYGSQLEPHLLYFKCQSIDLELRPATQDSAGSKSSTSLDEEMQLPLHQPSQSQSPPVTSSGQWEDVKNPDSKDSSLLLANETMKYTCEGFLTSPIKEQENGTNISSNKIQSATAPLVKHSGGKTTAFILFVNDRLVECPTLKRQVEDAYASHTPWPKPPFVYLNFQVPPNQVDVNVHPTKSQVALLFLDDIVHDVVQRHLVPILSEQGRSFSSQSHKSSIKLSPKTPSTSASTPSSETMTLSQSQESGTPPLDKDFGKAPARNVRENQSEQINCPSAVAAAAAAAAMALTAKTPARAARKPGEKSPSIFWSPGQMEKEIEWEKEKESRTNKWSNDPEWDAFWQDARDGKQPSPYLEQVRAKKFWKHRKKKRKAKGDENNDDDGDKKPPAKKKKTPSSKKIRTDIKIPLGSLEPFLEPQPMSVMMEDLALQIATPKNQRRMLEERAKKLAASKKPEDKSEHHLPDCPLLKATATDESVNLSNPGEFAKVAKECTCRHQLPPDFRVINSVQKMIRPVKRRPTKIGYTSIKLLRSRVKEATDDELLKKLRQAYFVGVLSRNYSLIQCQERLCMITHTAFAKVLFAQMALTMFGPDSLARRVARVGKVGCKKGSQCEGLDVQVLVEQALQLDEECNSALGNNPDTTEQGTGSFLPVSEANALLARQTAECLRDKAPMLKEYFGIWLEEVAATTSSFGLSPGVRSPGAMANEPNARVMLTGLPIIMDGHSPAPHGLPRFLLRLATQVDWVQERCCFDGVCRELGMFYGVMPLKFDKSQKAWVQHVLFPALSCLLDPPERLNAHLVTISSLTKLYKDFQR